MREYLRSTRVRIGLVLLVLGSGPLFAVGIAATLGLTDDPNPNPVIFGIMAFFTFWPAILLILTGVSRVSSDRRKRLRQQTSRPP